MTDRTASNAALQGELDALNAQILTIKTRQRQLTNEQRRRKARDNVEAALINAGLSEEAVAAQLATFDAAWDEEA